MSYPHRLQRFVDAQAPVLGDVVTELTAGRRHSDVSLLALEPISGRAFGNWATGPGGQSRENADHFAAIGVDSGFDPERLGRQRIHAILHELTLQEEGRAA